MTESQSSFRLARPTVCNCWLTCLHFLSFILSFFFWAPRTAGADIFHHQERKGNCVVSLCKDGTPHPMFPVRQLARANTSLGCCCCFVLFSAFNWSFGAPEHKAHKHRHTPNSAYRQWTLACNAFLRPWNKTPVGYTPFAPWCRRRGAKVRKLLIIFQISAVVKGSLDELYYYCCYKVLQWIEMHFLINLIVCVCWCSEESCEGSHWCSRAAAVDGEIVH